jgi:RNA polymerase-interacting CarD/CdnL/TRCF family regulator
MVLGDDGASARGFGTAWSRRVKANQAKLESGDPRLIAEVVRDLSEIEAARGLSAVERRMLARAKSLS